MSDQDEKHPTTDEPPAGVIDPKTGEAHPNSGPQGGAQGTDAGTAARDLVENGTAGTEDDEPRPEA